MNKTCTNDLNCGMQYAYYILELAAVTLGISGLGPLQYDLSVLISL